MQLLPQDGPFLERALALAAGAAAFASPNPTVGCVLFGNGSVLGEGAHFYNNLDHAEIVALKEAALHGRSVRDATAYVTLEPCAHHGRTGPCADALVAAGVGRCVIATLDPNPLVRGKGIARLLGAGMEVTVAPPETAGAQRARRLNDAFAFAIQNGRPFVTLKAAVSRDGMLAPSAADRPLGTPFWLTGPAAREDVQRLRHASDAILTGIGTVLADNPALTDRTGRARRRPLLRVVLDSDLRIPLDSAMVRSCQADVAVFCSAEASANRERGLRARGVNVQRCPTMDGALDLAFVLDRLFQLSVRSVLLEAGSVVNGAFLKAGLVDRVVFYEVADELGVEGVPFAHDGPTPAQLEKLLREPSQASFAHGQAEDVRVTGYLHDPWESVAEE